MKLRLHSFGLLIVATPLLAVAGCNNSPYPAGLTKESVYFLSQADDPRKLDPASSYRANEGQILDVICSSYYQYQPLKTKTFELELNLGAKEAERAPYTYIDATTKKQHTGERWTFHIRQDLKFQNDPCFPEGEGRAITAKDFLYAFRRMADPANASPVQGFFVDKIIGFNELINRNAELLKKGSGADYTTPVQGLQLDPNDPYTFHIALNQVYPQMRYLMAMHFTTPMPHEAVKYYGKDIERHPVGCGPFVLEEWTPKRRLVLAKNPNRPFERYPSEGDAGDEQLGILKAAGKQLPLVDKVIVSNITEGTTGWNLFLQGYVDTWSVTQTNYQQVISQQGSTTPEMNQRGIKLTKSSDVGVSYFAFNMEDPVFGGYTPQRQKLRQAVSLAVNSQEFIELFSQGNGRPAQGVIPPGIVGYDPNYRNPYRTFDAKLTKAKALLAEAGYPDGIDPKTKERLTLYYDNAKTDAAGRQFVSLISRQVGALGIRFESRSQRDIVWQNKIEGNDWQLTDYGWLADYPDAENFLFLLYGPNHRPGPNLTGYNNPAYNKLFEKIRAMDDGPERMKIMLQMRDMVEADCPLIYLQHTEKLALAYDWVGVLKAHPIANTLLKYRSVDGPERAERQTVWNKVVWWPLAALGALFIMGTLPALGVVKNRHRRRVTGKS